MKRPAIGLLTPAAEAALLLPLLLAPLFLGSVTPGPRGILSAYLCFGGAVAACAVVWRKRDPELPAGTVWILAFLALALLQTLPLGLSPSPEQQTVFGVSNLASLSIVPARTAQSLWLGAGVLALFAGSASLLTERGRAERFAAALVVLTTALSAYGLAVHWGLLPVRGGRTTTVVTSTYFNRNNFAGLLELGILTGAGLLLASRWKAAHRSCTGLRQVGLVAAIACCTAALVQTESRGGILALAAGTIGLGLLVASRQDRRRWRHVALFGAPLLIVLCLVPFSLASRFGNLSAELERAGGRIDIWQSGARLFEVAPWIGTGLGTYGAVSPLTQTAAIPGHVEHAHCDLLEVLVETGTTGALLLALAALWFFRAVLRRLDTCESESRRRLAAGALAGVGALFVHGLVDFNFQIPANLAWTAACAGLAWGISGSGRHRPMRAPLRAIAAGCAALLLTFAGYRAMRSGIAGCLIEAASQEKDAVRAVELLRTADRVDRGDGTATVEAGWRLLDADPGVDPRRLLSHAKAGLARNPVNPRANRLLGVALQRSGNRGAHRAFALGLRYVNPWDRPNHQLTIALNSLFNNDWEQGCAWIQELIADHPARRREVLAALYGRYPAWELIEPAVEDRDSESLRVLAKLMASQGDFAGREQVLAKLRGDRSGSELTVDSGARLVRHSLHVVEDASGRGIDCVLQFEVPEGTAPTPLALRCEAAGAAIFRPFTASNQEFRYRFALDPMLPPATYEVSLQFDPTAADYPLGTVDVEPRVLTLGLDQAVAAREALFWNTAVPDRRSLPDRGVCLRAGDRLWCSVVLPKEASELVVVGRRTNRIDVRFAGRHLDRLSRFEHAAARFALPPGRRGILTIVPIDSSEPAVEQVWCTARAVR